ncbi:Alanyl-tRNA editing protein Aarsd1-B [Nymphon striatum]|nr:Alanyl-tRNA editing protein Aarsd1-B [Nymphon striatum]
MTFECQRDSYKQKFTSIVESCTPTSVKLPESKESTEGFNVYLKDTILFPEGGGQPDDRGTIDGAPVHRVIRVADKACHFTLEHMKVGSEVQIQVDWERRFDHMQQHSGQHLITAIADSKYGFKTTSWNLGKSVSFIELDTPSITTEQIDEIEAVVNCKIRECVPVHVHEYADKNDKELQNARTRGLPEDHTGAVRMIEIKGIETDMCCGTHVSNLSHLQVVKLLYSEKGKKGKSNLYFVVGKRVLDYLSACLAREKTLSTLLKSCPEDHVMLVEKCQKSVKLAQKSNSSLMKDLATLEGKNFKQIQPRPKHFFMHRNDIQPEFMNRVIKEISDPNIIYFMSVGEDKGPGHVIIIGPQIMIDEINPRVCNLLGGKGFVKNGQFQAKVTNLSKVDIIEQYIKDLIYSDI